MAKKHKCTAVAVVAAFVIATAVWQQEAFVPSVADISKGGLSAKIEKSYRPALTTRRHYELPHVRAQRLQQELAAEQRHKQHRDRRPSAGIIGGERGLGISPQPPLTTSAPPQRPLQCFLQNAPTGRFPATTNSINTDWTPPASWRWVPRGGGDQPTGAHSYREERLAATAQVEEEIRSNRTYDDSRVQASGSRAAIPLLGITSAFPTSKDSYLRLLLSSIDHPIDNVTIVVPSYASAEHYGEVCEAVKACPREYCRSVTIAVVHPGRGRALSCSLSWNSLTAGIRSYGVIVAADASFFPGTLANVSAAMASVVRSSSADGKEARMATDPHYIDTATAQFPPMLRFATRVVEGPVWNFFVITKAVVDRVGLFDENFYPAYFEDIDFEWRVKTVGGVDMSRFDARQYPVYILHPTASSATRGQNTTSHWVDILGALHKAYWRGKVDAYEAAIPNPPPSGGTTDTTITASNSVVVSPYSHGGDSRQLNGGAPSKLPRHRVELLKSWAANEDLRRAQEMILHRWVPWKLPQGQPYRQLARWLMTRKTRYNIQRQYWDELDVRKGSRKGDMMSRKKTDNATAAPTNQEGDGTSSLTGLFSGPRLIEVMSVAVFGQHNLSFSCGIVSQQPAEAVIEDGKHMQWVWSLPFYASSTGHNKLIPEVERVDEVGMGHQLCPRRQ